MPSVKLFIADRAVSSTGLAKQASLKISVDVMQRSPVEIISNLIRYVYMQ